MLTFEQGKDIASMVYYVVSAIGVAYTAWTVSGVKKNTDGLTKDLVTRAEQQSHSQGMADEKSRKSAEVFRDASVGRAAVQADRDSGKGVERNGP